MAISKVFPSCDEIHNSFQNRAHFAILKRSKSKLVFLLFVGNLWDLAILIFFLYFLAPMKELVKSEEFKVVLVIELSLRVYSWDLAYFKGIFQIKEIQNEVY